MRELTGPTCSGKTTFLKENRVNAVKISVAYAFIGFLQLLVFHPKKGAFLLRKIWQADHRTWHRIRVFGHVFAKIGFYSLKGRTWSSINVDEGISHIPFILMLSEEDTIRFVRYFQTILEKIDILYFKVEEQMLRQRLLKRGHKRVKNERELNLFVANHMRIMGQYAAILTRHGINVEHLNDS